MKREQRSRVVRRGVLVLVISAMIGHSTNTKADGFRFPLQRPAGDTNQQTVNIQSTAAVSGSGGVGVPATAQHPTNTGPVPANASDNDGQTSYVTVQTLATAWCNTAPGGSVPAVGSVDTLVDRYFQALTDGDTTAGGQSWGQGNSADARANFAVTANANHPQINCGLLRGRLWVAAWGQRGNGGIINTPVNAFLDGNFINAIPVNNNGAYQITWQYTSGGDAMCNNCNVTTVNGTLNSPFGANTYAQLTRCINVGNTFLLIGNVGPNDAFFIGTNSSTDHQMHYKGYAEAQVYGSH